MGASFGGRDPVPLAPEALAARLRGYLTVGIVLQFAVAALGVDIVGPALALSSLLAVASGLAALRQAGGEEWTTSRWVLAAAAASLLGAIASLVVPDPRFVAAGTGSALALYVAWRSAVDLAVVDPLDEVAALGPRTAHVSRPGRDELA